MLRRGSWPYGLAAAVVCTFLSIFQARGETERPSYGSARVVPRVLLFNSPSLPAFAAKGDFNGDGFEDIAIGLSGQAKMLLRPGLEKKWDGTTRWATVHRHPRRIDIWERQELESHWLFMSSWERNLAPGTIPTSPQLIDVDSTEVLSVLALSLGVRRADDLRAINDAALPTTGSGWTVFDRKTIRRLISLSRPGRLSLSWQIRKKKGNCTNKSLLMALQLAVNGVSSRFVAAYVYDKYFGDFAHAYLEPLDGDFYGIEGRNYWIPSRERFEAAKKQFGRSVNSWRETYLDPFIPWTRPLSFTSTGEAVAKKDPADHWSSEDRAFQQ